jgi:hypothetical protein
MHYKKVLIKKEVKEGLITSLDKEELVLLTFTEEETREKLNWKHSNEFAFNDQMYDVVKLETKGDTSYFWCWLDHEETKLNRQLKELVNHTLGNDTQNREKQKQLITYFKSLYCSTVFTWNTITPSKTEKQLCWYSDIYSSLSLSPPTPPPRTLFTN